MTDFPHITTVGLTGLLVRFADRLDGPSNRGAIALRGAIESAGWEGVQEVCTSLASTYLGFDPDKVSHAELTDRLHALLATKDWTEAPLPAGRTLWHVPASFGGEDGPQLEEAAHLAGCSAAEAVAQFTAAPVQVLTLGFTAGQPYLGTLPPAWDIPRQTGLTPRVPASSLVVAVRQFVLFAAPATTGWRQVAQTDFPCIRLGQNPTFPLKPGDLMQFHAMTTAEREDRTGADATGMGGAWSEPAR